MSNNFLSIDTAMNACSVALLYNKKIISRLIVSDYNHEKNILPLVKDVLFEAKITLNQLDALVFNKGPGSFTGIRIGIAVVQGFSFCLNLPLIPVSSLMVLAEGAYRITNKSKVLTFISANSSKIYYAEYQRDKNGFWIGEETEFLIDQKCFKKKIELLTDSWSYAGSCYGNYKTMLDKKKFIVDSKIIFTNARDMLPIAIDLWSKNKIINIENIKPSYFIE